MGRERPTVLGGANRQRFEDMAKKTPTVGMTDVVDPSLDTGVEFGEADQDAAHIHLSI